MKENKQKLRDSYAERHKTKTVEEEKKEKFEKEDILTKMGRFFGIT